MKMTFAGGKQSTALTDLTQKALPLAYQVKPMSAIFQCQESIGCPHHSELSRSQQHLPKNNSETPAFCMLSQFGTVKYLCYVRGYFLAISTYLTLIL